MDSLDRVKVFLLAETALAFPDGGIRALGSDFSHHLWDAV